MRKTIVVMVTIIFVATAIANLITSSHFTEMSSSQRFLIIRFLLTIGLFASSIVGLTTSKHRVFAVVLGIAAIGLLFSIR